MDAVLLGAYSQGEKWYGKMDFIALAFDKAKLILIRDRGRKAYIVTRVHRSAAAEYVFSIVGATLIGTKARDRRG